MLVSLNPLSSVTGISCITRNSSSGKTRMSPQLKSRITTTALILVSIGGTSAIFGAVPLLAQLTSPQSATRPVAYPAPLSSEAAGDRDSQAL
jgi:hypothetical protein